MLTSDSKSTAAICYSLFYFLSNLSNPGYGANGISSKNIKFSFTNDNSDIFFTSIKSVHSRIKTAEEGNQSDT